MTDEREDGLKLFSPTEEAKTPEAAKFISENEGKNGISPISVDHLKAKFTGLTKEELMKFANDPFWVRLRWFLFALFWLIWLLMLFAAIFIIVVTPKCQESPPLVWWERSPLYVLDVKKLVPETASETTSIIGVLKNKITYLKQELGIESLLLKSVMDSKPDGSDEIMNFTNVDDSLDSLNSFQHEVIDFAKSQGVRIMLGFSPVYSGKMSEFVRSSIREPGFQDFYVWFPHNYTAKPDKFPNNWLSVYDTPAWEWDDVRKQFYLHQFNATQPDLNYRNLAVVDFMSNVLKFWLNLGVQGFYLDKTEYLLEDNGFENEVVGEGNEGFGLNQYGFYRHTRTFELRENIEILKKWSEIIRNASGIVSVSGGILEDRSVADFVLRPLTLRENFTASDLNRNITRWRNAVLHPTWEWKCAPPNSTCIRDTDVNCLTIVNFLLPGVPVVHDSNEFKKPNNSENSSENKVSNGMQTNSSVSLDLIKELIKLRMSPAVSFGSFESTVINGSVFAFTRIKAGNPGYLVAWNLGSEKVTINFPNNFKTVPEDLVVTVKSSPSSNDSYELKNKVSSVAVDILPKSAVVFRFVPSLK